MSKMADSGIDEQQRQMMAHYKIKPGIDPIGTKHTLATDIQGLPRKANYKVRYITGGNNNTPNQDPPIVWLRVTGRHGFPVTPYISVPLPVLVDDFVPFSGQDVFWFDSSIKKA